MDTRTNLTRLKGIAENARAYYEWCVDHKVDAADAALEYMKAIAEVGREERSLGIREIIEYQTEVIGGN